MLSGQWSEYTQPQIRMRATTQNEVMGVGITNDHALRDAQGRATQRHSVNKCYFDITIYYHLSDSLKAVCHSMGIY